MALTAHRYYSGFELAHDVYNALSIASDGNVYYVLSSEDITIGGHFYRYNPRKDDIRLIGDLTELCGEGGDKVIGQGKSHVQFYERGHRLYFATHVGFYEQIDGMDRLPVDPPDGYGLYPGGHILAYDLETGDCIDLAKLPNGEGMVSMTMDAVRGHIYGISWPTGHFIHYDLEKDILKDHGPISHRGEAGTPGGDFRVLCRSLVTDPRTGIVYFSNAEGDILYYRAGDEEVGKLENVHLRLDYFGTYDPTQPGDMAYNWRKVFWHPTEEVVYGVHGNSGYLFRFDPHKQKITLVERLTSEPSRKSGFFDQFSYGYLGFTLGPDQETIYYLTGGPIYKNNRRVKGKDQIAKGAARGLENLHLVTYHLPTDQYQDHGPVFYEDGSRPTYVNSIAVGQEGYIYTLARMTHQGKTIQDLVRIPDPLK
ncbi:hypothetical protein [Fodinibius sediminis]|uniref:Uncharacterized protein n=1 Tax=Fodinibius sediminis TaxID=1214077 RepID=A0A521CSG9_9BACT|nr:hypothetical protein [Fodinibius sediminis]SMO62439.1 hypothetical protein SAMN06265218_10770 [Fodinibius sediminis]